MTDDATYVAFGDSITEGHGVAWGFVSYLARLLQEADSRHTWKIINRGMSGETSREALYRLEADVLAHKPNLVTINFGVNDAFSDISPEAFRDILERMILPIRAGGCSMIVLLSSEVIPDPWAERQVGPYWDAMRTAAEECGGVYSDVNGRWRQELENGRPEEELIIWGDLHPNEEGHRLIAETVFETIKANGLFEGPV